MNDERTLEVSKKRASDWTIKDALIAVPFFASGLALTWEVAFFQVIRGGLSCTRFRRHQVRCFMEQEVCHGETEVHARVQA